MAPTPKTILHSLPNLPKELRNEIIPYTGPKLQQQSPNIKRPPTLLVKSYRALVRVIGFYWYQSENVLLRGQEQCFGSLQASAWRPLTSSTPTLPMQLDGFLQRFRQAIKFDRAPLHAYTTEPLLQHYGLRTRWLDLVDSIPHALFFAIYQCTKSPFADDKKPFADDKKPCIKTYIPCPSGKGVIYIINTGRLDPFLDADGKPVPGLYKTDWGGQICDLRRSKPSLALRPHAQHGWLCRPDDANNNMWDRILARVFFDKSVARSWLGGATSLSRESLFPPPSWDDVFDRLLRHDVTSFLAQERSSGIDIGIVSTYDFHDP